MKLLSINYTDAQGGAARVAWDLFSGYRRRGHPSAMVVGRKLTGDPDVFPLPRAASGYPWERPMKALSRAALRAAQRWPGLGFGRIYSTAESMAHFPNLRWWDHLMGWECFRYPGTRRLFEVAPFQPDLIHAHNLHADYFDLRYLPWITARAPTVVTLHDAWMLSGHCAFSMGCDRWRTGCGHCPDLGLAPAIRRDATARNRRVKARIFQNCRLYVVTPSQWLMDKVEASILRPSVIQSRVVPNGVDRRVFRPGSREAARRRLGIPRAATVLMAAAPGLRHNPRKNWRLLHQALIRLSQRRGREPVLALGVGEAAPGEDRGRVQIRYVGQQPPETLADYYRAADMYVHPSRADNLPLVVLEALACGTPVVATRVGGVPEAIRQDRSPERPGTGVMVEPDDAEGLCEALEALVQDPARRVRMGRFAAEDAQRFDLETMIDRYLGFFEEILREQVPNPPASKQ